MRSYIQNALDLEDLPTWRELVDGLAAAVAVVAVAVVACLAQVAMGVHP